MLTTNGIATIPILTSRREMVKAWFDMIVARPAINNSQLEMKIEGCCATFAPCPRHAWTVSVGEIKKRACLQRLYKKSWSVVAKPLLLHLINIYMMVQKYKIKRT